MTQSLGPNLDLARCVLRLRRPIPSRTGGNLPAQERLYVRLKHQSESCAVIGYGEAAPHPTTGPSLGSIEDEIAAAVKSDVVASRCMSPGLVALASLDAMARANHLAVWRHLDWPKPREDLRTMVSFGGNDAREICEEISREKPAGIKLKLCGTPDDVSRVRDIRRAFNLPMALDVNGGWRYDEAVRNLRALESFAPDLLWIEQPCAPEEMERLPTGIPILADEAVRNDGSYDLRAYDGIVLKPASEGLLECSVLASKAKERGQMVTLGCHLQSSLLTAASLHLSGFVTTEWVDLDSALLLEEDPFTPPVLNKSSGNISLPSGVGLCTNPRILLTWTPQDALLA